MSKSLVRLAAPVAATLAGLASFPVDALANAKVCRSWEQRYEQIQRGPSTIEINAMLFTAADKGCFDLAKLLLSDGASLDARDRLGARPLARAAVAGEAELVTLFLERGAPIDARDLDGSTALFKAAEAGRLPMVKLLAEPRPERHHASVSRRLYGKRSDRAVPDRQGRRRECD